MNTGTPARVAIFAARIFVIMPPVPFDDPVPAAAFSISFVILSILSIRRAVLSFDGFAVYSPSTSVRSMRRFA